MIEVIEKELTKLATIRTPSKTKYFAQVNSINDLNEAVLFSKNHTLKLIILGNGTNILFTKDNYSDKLFIKLGKGFNSFEIYKDFVEIGGSSSFINSGKKLTDLGYQDFVYMTLIPGSLGGGIRQNAGTTKEGEVKDNFISANIYDLKEQKCIILNKEEMQFSYRNSFIQAEKNRYIVLSAKFLLGKKTEDLESLKKFVKEKQKAKNSKEPAGFSFGSTFKSIIYPKPAWWYIEQVGLRSKKIGGAEFSKKHSNWIINYNNATAKDILDLIEEAKEKVDKDFSIKLQTEIELI